jgi:hypothetical protein
MDRGRAVNCLQSLRKCQDQKIDFGFNRRMMVEFGDPPVRRPNFPPPAHRLLAMLLE